MNDNEAHNRHVKQAHALLKTATDNGSVSVALSRILGRHPAPGMWVPMTLHMADMVLKRLEQGQSLDEPFGINGVFFDLDFETTVSKPEIIYIPSDDSDDEKKPREQSHRAQLTQRRRWLNKAGVKATLTQLKFYWINTRPGRDWCNLMHMSEKDYVTFAREFVKSSKPKPKATLPPKEEEEKKSSRAECSICMDSASVCCMVPCGHVCLCVACAVAHYDPGLVKRRKEGAAPFPAALKCPLCRTPLTSIVQTF